MGVLGCLLSVAPQRNRDGEASAEDDSSNTLNGANRNKQTDKAAHNHCKRKHSQTISKKDLQEQQKLGLLLTRSSHRSLHKTSTRTTTLTTPNTSLTIARKGVPHCTPFVKELTHKNLSRMRPPFLFHLSDVW